MSDIGQSNVNYSHRCSQRLQDDDAERSHCDRETAVKTRLNSSLQFEEQMQLGGVIDASPVHRCLLDEDVDMDGPPDEEFDFRSTDGASSIHGSDVVSFRTDDETGTYTFTPDESVTSQSSILYGTQITDHYTMSSAITPAFVVNGI